MNNPGLSLVSIVDDNESVRTATHALLRSVGYNAKTFESAELFLESGALAETACLILDLSMPGLDGLGLQRQLASVRSEVPIIFVSAHDDTVKRQAAMDEGALGFFPKPFGGAALVDAIELAIGVRRKI